MPFSLKNTNVNFQEVANHMFSLQIDCNIKEYINDILVKSKSFDNTLDDIRETFQTLQQYGFKLIHT